MEPKTEIAREILEDEIRFLRKEFVALYNYVNAMQGILYLIATQMKGISARYAINIHKIEKNEPAL